MGEKTSPSIHPWEIRNESFEGKLLISPLPSPISSQIFEFFENSRTNERTSEQRASKMFVL